MSEKQAIPQHTSTLAFETYTPTAPILSSVQAGWEGIIRSPMSEKQAIPQHTSTLAFETYTPTAPILSSVQAGWEGIIRSPMSEKQAIPQHTSTLAFETYTPTAPILSSVQAGWEGIIVRTYHEPMVVERVIAPAVPDVSLVMVTGGAIHLESRDVGGSWEAFTLVEGDWFLTPGGGMPYELRWSSLSSQPIQTLHVHVSTDLVSRAALQLADRDPARVELVERAGFQDPLLAQMGLALRQELHVPAPAGKLYAETAAQMLAVHLLRHYLATDVSIKDVEPRLTSPQMKRIMDYIQAHLNQNLSLEALAQQIGFSAYHFARLFRQTTGESPHQFVLYKRIEAAQHLLKETDLPLAQIALEVGFPHQSHFTHAFKRRLGLTPYRYRQES